ncbi:MAG: DUF1549 and DUF1553 domain-containing protein [Gemmataceae bacterium]
MPAHARCIPALLAVLLLGAAPRSDIPVSSLQVFPPTIQLAGPRAEQRVGVLGLLGDGTRRDLSREAVYRFSRPGIANVTAEGLVRPLADGRTQLEIVADGKTLRVPVEVQGFVADVPVSFSREVEPVLTRTGCNMGACHGAQFGKGGFRLSLFGFDPAFDHSQIVQSAEGRRVVLSEPERSILLAKPAGVMDHVGGERFKIGSRYYDILKRWIEDGVPGPSGKDPTVKAVEVWPASRRMLAGEQQQILVRATWSNGLVEDVTSLAQFDALNDSIAAVTPDGLITAKGVGESHIMVRFAGQARVVQVTRAYGPPSTQNFPANNFIDEKLAARWRGLGLAPSDLCSDEEFLRRLYLDAIGTLPTPLEIRTFLADRSPDRRTKAIDRVLDRPEFVDFWSLKWGDLLRINRDLLQEKGMWSFHNWVRASLRDSKPMDQMVNEVITAEGSTFIDGPANFYLTARTPADWSEAATQVFLGVRIGCARCHHHPFEKWSQDDYWGMTAFFSRLGTKNSQEFGLFGRETVVFLRPTGEVSHPRKGGVVKPRALGGEVTEDPADRRRKLAEWLTAKDNPFFARNMANRFWAYIMGRGLVEPIDDLRETNPASIPELLDALADHLVQQRYDLKAFLRTIFQSRAYQLASRATPGNRADASNTFYTRYTRKRLTAEQLADALDFATGTQEKYQGLPLGTRAIQLPDTRVRSFLLDIFGRPARQITCECERTMQPNIAQALHLLNSDFLERKIAAPTGRIAGLIRAKKSPGEILDELYLTTLSRLPRPAERERDLAWLQRTPTLAEGAHDLLWVLLNRREFQFVQ